MFRNNRMAIVFILFFFLGAMVFAQDKQVNEGKDRQLREKILAVYKSRGEEGLWDFVKKKKDKITNKFIINFAKEGVKGQKENWLKVCEILSEKMQDETAMAAVYLQMVKYYSINIDFKRAFKYIDRALLLMLKINDPLGLGKIYLAKGRLFFYTGDNSMALEMYEKALPYFDKANYPRGQGDVRLRIGNIYSRDGDNKNAIEMYDKAISFFEKAGYLIGQSELYINKGRIYFFGGDNRNALEMLDKAISVLEKSNKGAMNMQGEVYRFKGDIYLITSKASKALEMFDKALLIFEKTGSLIGLGNTYFALGRFFAHKGETTKALEMYDKALSFFQQAKNLIGQGNVYLKKGDIYVSIGENSKAIEMYDKALFFSEKTHYLLNKGNVYVSKGYLYSRIGDYTTAILMYDRALVLFKKMNEPRGQANVYLEKGDIYHYTGEYSKAIEELDKALLLFESAEDYLGQGNVYQDKGKIYTTRREYLKAIEMLDKALLFYKKDRHLLGQGSVYFRKGDIYLKTGNDEKANTMYDEALDIFEKIEDNLSLGNVFARKGVILTNGCKNLDALKMLGKALTFFEKSEDPLGQGNVYMNIGDIYFYSNQNAKAIEMYDKSLLFFKKSRNPFSQGNIYQGKGNVYLRIGENSKAFEMYDKAFSLYKKGEDIESESYALHGKAKVFAKLGKKEKALDLFEKGIANLEKVRTQTAFSEMKRTLMEKVYEQYEETVLFMVENKYYDKGFKYADSMKARVFLDQMAEGLVSLEKGLKPKLKEERDELVAKLSYLSKAMYKTGGKEEKKLAELKEKYRKTENDFEELLIKIRLENPLYAEVRYPQPVPVRELQKKVLKKGELLLHYFISPDKIYVFLVSKKKLKVVPLEVKEEQVKSYVNRLLLAMKENNKGDMKTYGRLLYQKLFKPVEAKLKRTRDIIIIPHSHLEKIPFESFIIGEDKSGQPVFLLEKYRVKYIQSASLLSILRKHYQRDRETNNFIGFGDPVYDYENYKQGQPERGSMKTFATKIAESIFSREDTRSDTKEKRLSSVAIGDEITEIHRGKYHREGGKLVRLQGSGEEVKTIAELFKKQNQKSVVFLRAKATEENARAANLKDFDFIHFACHGILGETFQSLVLSRIPEAKEDGYFTMNEIMNCNYNAKLVVLSACQTGSGKMYKGEGVTGLTRAVMYAGTPAVIASLWKVDDRATKELMVKFYKNMLEKNMDKTEALRQAKLDLLKNKKYASPLFWSAFVLYGE